jgi:hypothetical protein
MLLMDKNKKNKSEKSIKKTNRNQVNDDQI